MFESSRHSRSTPATSSSGSARSFWTRIGVPAAIATLVSLALSGGGLYWAAERSDAISVDHQMRASERSIDASILMLSQLQTTNAVWDEPVLRMNKPYDPKWFAASVGVQSDYLFPGVELYLLNSRDRPVYAYANRGTVPPGSFESVRPAIAGMIEEVRGRVLPHNHMHDRLPGIGPPPRPLNTPGRNDDLIFASHLVRLHDRPAAVSVMHVVPTSPSIVLPRGQEPLLVIVRYFDRSFLADLSERGLLESLRVSKTPNARSGEVTKRLADDDGHEIGYLIWTPRMPGSQLLATLKPLTALSAAITIALMIWLVWTARRMFLEVEAARAVATHRSLHDPLTGLPNRELFADRLQQAVARARRGPRSALLILDLDRFKAVNDTLGHAAGDAVLCEFADRARAALRSTDTIARLGGDEFAIILSDSSRARDVEPICEALLEATRRPFLLAEGTASIGASIGIALVTRGDADVDTLIARADRALYAAKNDGRNCFRFARGAPTLVAVAA